MISSSVFFLFPRSGSLPGRLQEMWFRRRTMSKRKGFTKSVAFTLVLAMLFATLSFGGVAGLPGVPGAGGAEVYGAESSMLQEAIDKTINGYYLEQRKGVLTDWEEVVAVVASGGDLSKYTIPTYKNVAPSSDLILALVTGDLTNAAIKANDTKLWIQTPGKLTEYSLKADTAMAYAYSILALEAYNRSVAEEDKVTYGTEAAINRLSANYSGETDYIFGDDYGYPATDMAGLALVALSLFNDNPDVSTTITAIKSEIREFQDASGGFNGSVNTTAAVLWGLLALQENLSDWTTGAALGPVEGLLSYSLNSGGYLGYQGDTGVNALGTKQAHIAALDAYNAINSGESLPFYASFQLNDKYYTAVDVQVIDSSGTFQEIYNVGVDRDVSEENSVDKALQTALATSGAVSYENYRIYIDGSLADGTKLVNQKITDIGSILAVHSSFNKVLYFTDAENLALGIPEVEIANGLTHDFTILETDLINNTTISKGGVYINGNGALISNDGFSTAEDGKISVTPIVSLDEYQLSIPNRVPYPDKENISSGAVALPAKITMRKGDPQSESGISIRIEGPGFNILNVESMIVGNTDGSRLTVFDAVKRALEENNVDYQNSGSYIYSIGGVSAGIYEGNGGWVYTFPNDPQYLNGSKYANAMDMELLSNHKDILIYYINSNWSTIYPAISTTKNDDGSITVSAKKYDYGASTPELPIENADVFWSFGTEHEYVTITNASGEAIIPVTAAAIGSHTLQVTKMTESGPDIIPLPPGYTIEISELGTSVTTPVVTEKKAYLTVSGPSGTLKSRTGVNWYKGMTALSLLQQSGLGISYDSSGTYVQGINGIEEFDYGAKSGWLYSVNGVTPPVTAANRYSIDADDEVIWYYTKDFTKDTSSSAWVTENQAGAAQDGLVSVTTDVKAVTGSDGTAKATVSTTQLDTAVTDALKAAAASKDDAKPAITIAVEADSKAQGVETVIPKIAFANLVNKGIQQMTLQSPLGNMTLDLETLKDIVKGGTGDISLSIKKADEPQGRPVIRLEINNGGKIVGTFSKPITITVPYTTAAGETEQGIAVFHLDDKGQWKNIKASKYDSKNKAIVFRTDHFSDFVIAYSYKTFGDIKGHWAQTPIEYLASRRIIQGMTEESFVPNGTITRAQFVTLLAGMAGADLSKYSLSQFNDVKDNAWYKGAVSWAAENGIVQGQQAADGSFWFNPNQNISRQDMAVIMMRYLAWAKEPIGETTNAIAFKDSSSIAAYAKESVTAMQKAGLINGRTTQDNQTTFDPTGKLTRAEAAQMLTNQLYKQF